MDTHENIEDISISDWTLKVHPIVSEIGWTGVVSILTLSHRIFIRVLLVIGFLQ